MKRMNYHMADDQVKRLRKLAAQKGTTVADLVRRAVEAYLAAEKREAKQR